MNGLDIDILIFPPQRLVAELKKLET